MSDERVREAQWHADIDALYCSECQHPHGYHDAERGCTMPLDTEGLPLTNSRTVIPAGPCRCKESDSHKMARLEQARKDTYDKYIEAVRAMSVFMAEISARES